MADGPLARWVVVEAGRDVALRYCGRLFAQLGATVVRAPSGDDELIGYGGAAGSAYGRWLDQGKRAELPAGRVDLVLAGLYGAGVAAGQALADGLPGAPSLLALTWFHPDGPYGDWRGTDELMLALCGLAYPFGEAAGPPTLAQGHGPQIAAGVVAFNAALGALIASPRPRRIAVNVFEAFMCLTETGAVSALMEGGGSVRLGVNRFVPEDDEHAPKIEPFRIDPEIERGQIERVRAVRASRSRDTWTTALAQVETAAQDGSNLVPTIIAAVEARATLGEIADAMRRVFGEHQET